MFIHEIFKNADPKRLAMTGESNITYGQLEKAVENYRNTLYAMAQSSCMYTWQSSASARSSCR